MTGDNFSAPVIWSRKDIFMKKEILLQAIISNGSAVVGDFSLDKEIEIAVGLAGHAINKMEIRYMVKNPSIASVYNAKLQNLLAETSEEEATKAALKAVKKASNKILWLNTVIKKLEGEGFVDRVIDKASPNACLNLIKDFYTSFDVEILKRIA